MQRLGCECCLALLAGMETKEATLPKIIQEMLLTRISERSGCVIDPDQAVSMGKNKRKEYF